MKLGKHEVKILLKAQVETMNSLLEGRGPFIQPFTAVLQRTQEIAAQYPLDTPDPETPVQFD